MNANLLEIIAAVLFAMAVLHTFSVKRFLNLARKYPEGSIGESFFHLMGEVEIVFGVWAGILVSLAVFLNGSKQAFAYVESLNFTEPAFVFVIMAMASTKPILASANRLIVALASLLPLPSELAFLFTALTVGPLLGSFITEPAAMTVTALLIKERFFDRRLPESLKYAAIAVLFVNVSIGGVLTQFAAPPVLMVASVWSWDLSFMLSHFGWKATIAVVINSSLLAVFCRKSLSVPIAESSEQQKPENRNGPWWLTLLHFGFIAATVLTAHHPLIFLGLFLFFLGLTTITSEYQDDIKLKESLLVAFFLAGLVVLGGLQGWWLKPLIANLSDFSLFAGATALTAIVDNAALTYLGTQVSSISESMKYALVAGAVSGGGLTVIANAPNPAGFNILQKSFGAGGISPLKLLTYALLPTFIAMLCFWLL